MESQLKKIYYYLKTHLQTDGPGRVPTLEYHSLESFIIELLNITKGHKVLECFVLLCST
jgi:hypothetical protein